MFLPHPRVKVSIVGSLRDRDVACSASDRQGSNFESCVWRTVSSQSSHHPQEVLLAQFSLYVHKGGLKPDSFHLISMFYLCYVDVLFLSFWSIPSCSSLFIQDFMYHYVWSMSGQWCTCRVKPPFIGFLEATHTDTIWAPLHTMIKIHLFSNVSMPGQRRRLWPSIEPILRAGMDSIKL